jgi:transcription elongation factor GreA
MSSSAPVDESLITAQGYELLRAELERLQTDGRRDVGARLLDARHDGPLGDNPALAAVLEEQEQLETRIAALEAQLAVARVARPTRDGSAGVGSSVRVRHLHNDEVAEYELVGVSDPGIGDGRVSVAAPVGRALAGRRAGARIEVSVPRGLLALEILSVQQAAA